MKTLLIEAPGNLRMEERKIPVPEAGDILIRVVYVGFCGSDLSTWMGRNPMVSYPRIPGHEVSGIIEETGDDVPGDLMPGDAVTVVPYTSCGFCSSCKKGRYNACRNNQTMGVQRDGAMQEFVVVPWQKVMKAKGLSPLALALVEPLTVGFHAIDRAGVETGDRVLVLGCGMIGAGAIVGALERSATVIAVDVDDHKLGLAGELGAQHLINSVKGDLHQELKKICGENGPDVVVEAAGNPVTYRTAIEEVGFAGRVVCIGYAAKEVKLPTKQFVQKEIDILGSRNATPDDFRAVIAYLDKGQFPVDRMITRILNPGEAKDALKTWEGDPGKVMKLIINFSS